MSEREKALEELIAELDGILSETHDALFREASGWNGSYSGLERRLLSARRNILAALTSNVEGS